ncbi:DASH complex subunit Dad3-domain-containing protein [Thermoascus aurantiacus ATCC 26904]
MSYSDDAQTADPANNNNNNNETPIRNNPLLRSANPLVSDLEQEVLDEYARLLDNVNKLASALDHLAGDPASVTLDGLRLLERKTATVCTLLKASVYSIVLQQQIYNDNENEQGQGQGQYQDGGDGGEGYEGEGEGDVTAIRH